MKGLGFVPCEQRRAGGPRPPKGRAGRGDQFSHCGHSGGGDRARAAGEQGERPRPLEAQVSAAGLRVCLRLRCAGRRGPRGGGCRAHGLSPLCWEAGGVRASGTQLAAGPSCTQWGRGWPSHSGSTVRALRQSAQCPRRAAAAGPPQPLATARADADKSRRPAAGQLPPHAAYRCPPGRVSQDTGFGPDSEARLKTGSGPRFS